MSHHLGGTELAIGSYANHSLSLSLFPLQDRALLQMFPSFLAALFRCFWDARREGREKENGGEKRPSPQPFFPASKPCLT